MRRTNGSLALLASFALAAAAAPGVLATEASGPALVYEPPSNRVLTPADITFERNKRTGAVALKDRRGGPLAVTSLEVFGPTGASIQRTGADFTSPALWQAQGFGDVCWSSAPEADPYVLPMPDQAYGAPAGDWEYQNVIVTTAEEPIVYNLPQPGQSVTGQGAPMESVIFCVRAVDTTQMRLRPLAEESSDSASATPASEASSSSSAASESASPSSSTSTASASAESSESSSPTQTPEPSEPSESETSDPSESASATSDSTSRPRPLPSVTSTPSKDEVESFVAPLLNVTVKKKPVDEGQDDSNKEYFCHSRAYGNPENGKGPYQKLKLAKGTVNGHEENHTGNVYSEGMSDKWGDIIPPAYGHPGLNWDESGIAIYRNDCEYVRPPSPDTGRLTITNTVAVPESVAVPDGTYSFGWTCSKGHHNGDDEYRDDHKDQSGTLEVAPGETGQVLAAIDEGSTCGISKVDLPGVSDAYEWQTSLDPEVVRIVAGQDGNLTADNTLTAQYGTLAITNTVEGGAPDVPSEGYYFDWSCSRDHHGGGDDEYRDDHKDQSGTLAVAPGKTEQVDAEIKDGSTCRVSLDSRPDAPKGYYWEQASFDPEDVEVDKGFVSTITATNTLTPKERKGKGSLTIALDPLDNPDGSPTQDIFTFDYTCSYSKETAQALGRDYRDDVKSGTRKLRPGTSKTIDWIPAGQSCTVTERQPKSVPDHSWQIDYSSQPVTITSGGVAEVTVTNHLTADKGSLTVTLAGEVTDTESFTVFYHCYGFGGLAAGSAVLTAGNPTKTWAVPSESRCVVSEKTPQAPPGEVYVTDIEPSAVWIAGSEEETVTVTNLLKPSNEMGALVLQEILSDAPSDYTPDFDLTYSCTVNGTSSVASAVVPSGGSTSVNVAAGSTCQVTDSEALETAPSGYAFEPFEPPAAVMVGPGGEGTLTAMNTLVAAEPDPIITGKNIALTSMCKPSPDEGRLRLRGPAGADWVLAMYHSDTAYSGVFEGADVFVDVPWTSSKDTWTLTVTGSDGTSGNKTKAIGDNDPCTTPVPDPTAPPSPDPVEPQPISPSVDPGGADTPSSAEETDEQAVENRVLDFCDSKDPADLPEGMADAEVAMTVTNGVSTTEVREPWANLYCVAKANRSAPDAIKAGSVDSSGASGSSGGSGSSDDVLAKTGGTALTATVAGGVILLGLALVVAPARRRRG